MCKITVSMAFRLPLLTFLFKEGFCGQPAFNRFWFAEPKITKHRSWTKWWEHKLYTDCLFIQEKSVFSLSKPEQRQVPRCVVRIKWEAAEERAPKALHSLLGHPPGQWLSGYWMKASELGWVRMLPFPVSHPRCLGPWSKPGKQLMGWKVRWAGLLRGGALGCILSLGGSIRTCQTASYPAGAGQSLSQNLYPSVAEDLVHSYLREVSLMGSFTNPIGNHFLSGATCYQRGQKCKHFCSTTAKTDWEV